MSRRILQKREGRSEAADISLLIPENPQSSVGKFEDFSSTARDNIMEITDLTGNYRTNMAAFQRVPSAVSTMGADDYGGGGELTSSGMQAMQAADRQLWDQLNEEELH